MLKDPKQRRFFKAKDLAIFSTWEEDTHGGGGRGGGDGGKEDAIETAELFAEVEGERAADVDVANKEDEEVDDDDDEVEGEVVVGGGGGGGKKGN